MGCRNSWRSRTGAAEDTGHLDELDGLLAGIHLGGMRESSDEGGESLGGLEEEADVKMNLPCVGSSNYARAQGCRHLTRRASRQSYVCA